MTLKLSRLSTVLNHIIPRTKTGDFIFSWLKFARAHHRAPKKDSGLFNDTLFQIKVSGKLEDPLRVFVTDKEYFKIYVKAKVGEKYVVPTEAILRCKSDVDAYDFANSFCAKPTHMSGKVIIVNNCTFSREEIKSWFDLNHYTISRERNYRLLQHKVIVEPIIFGESDITDFRVYCYKGSAKLICLDIGKYSEYMRAFYSLSWKKQGFSLGYPLYDGEIERPSNIDEIIHVAQELASEFNFVRVDFYTNGDQFFVGEITHCHASASQRFVPLHAEQVASDVIFSEGPNAS